MPEQPAVLVMEMNGVQGGRSEKYLLRIPGAGGLGGLIEVSKAICFGRTAFFATGVKLVYARLSRAGGAPDRKLIPLDYPLTTHGAFSNGGGVYDVPGVVNDDNVSVFQTFETDTDTWSNHYYNFVPDAWVSDMKIPAALFPYFQARPDAPVNIGRDFAGSHLEICQNFWKLLQVNTFAGTKITSTSYNLKAIANIATRGVTRHNLGRFRKEHRGRRPSTLIQ